MESVSLSSIPTSSPSRPLKCGIRTCTSPMIPKPDEKGNFDPQRHTAPEMVGHHQGIPAAAFGLQVSPDYLFDCLAGKYQGRFSEEIDEKVERLWYIRALRMGCFLFDGKVGVGFSCRSRRCQRIRCPSEPAKEEKGPENDSIEWTCSSWCRSSMANRRCR